MESDGEFVNDAVAKASLGSRTASDERSVTLVAHSCQKIKNLLSATVAGNSTTRGYSQLPN